MLVTCDYNYEESSLDAVDGPNDDAKEMKTTFDELGYYVVQLKNETATKDEIDKVLWQLNAYLEKYDKQKENKVLIFAFSGHGKEVEKKVGMQDDKIKVVMKEVLATYDGYPISVIDEILPHFVQHSNVFQIPKLFFINACRGEREIQLKAVLGGRKFPKTPNYTVGNYLIAYATIPDHVAYDKWWMNQLAVKIRSRKYEPLSIILDDLAKEIKEELQPEYVSRLRGSFRFC